jgi:hypothetical protein
MVSKNEKGLIVKRTSFTSSFKIRLSKGQLISKANSKFSFEPKNQRKYFCISALASKSGQIKKI